MALIDTIMSVAHLLVGGVWVGSVVFFAGVVLPAARDGQLDAAPVESAVGTLIKLSRGSSVVMFLSGGHLAGTRYTVGTLTGTPRGHLVIGMVALWFVFTGLIEVSRSRLVDGLQTKKVRAPAEQSLTLFRAAAVVGLLLLVNAGLLL